jgi:hypothetical protein
MRCILSLLFIMALAPAVFAGNNAGGRAWLSWDRPGNVSTLSSAPVEAFPLYVQLRDATDVRALAMNVVWSPYDSLSRCYAITSAVPSGPETQPDSAFGAISALPPTGSFDGDSSYTWSILFPSGSSQQQVVLHLVAAPLCPEETAAQFLLASVLAMDSNGLIDTLAVVGEASITPVPTVTGVEPNQVDPSVPATLRIRGSQFVPGAEVRLRKGGAVTPVTEVVVQDSSQIIARFVPTAEQQGPLDVQVALPSGLSGTLLEGVTVASALTASSVYLPTDEAAGFRRIDLYADQTAHFHDNPHINSSFFPASLHTPTLLVQRSASDTVGLFDSRPHNGIGLQDLGWWWTNSFVRFNARREPATSIGLLSVGSLVTNSTGDFNDLGKSLIRVIRHYTDGDSVTDSLRVGIHVRNYQTGTIGCNSQQHPMYTTLPTDPLAGQVWTGTQGSTQYFYDVQELRVDPGRRPKRLLDVEVRADSILHDRTCTVQSTSAFYGLSLWNQFTIGPAGAGVPLQTQHNATWAGDSYGGYVYNDTLIGQHRTIGEFGCVTACLSMANTYYGAACNPRSLNQYLQGHSNGHFFTAVARITSVAGNNVTFSLLPGARTVGPTFLIQEGRNAPLATVAVQSIIDTTGAGLITQRFRGGGVSIGDYGMVYDEVNYLAASAGFSSGTWQVTGLKPKPGDTFPALAESTMAADDPVFLYTGIDTSGATHWVVGEGREPAFISATAARGTYRIKDPGYLDGSGQPLRRLLQSPHKNKFQSALACTVLASERPQDAPAATISGEGLAVRVQGAATVELTDPMGRTITYDAGQDRYVSGIPNAIALRRFSLVAPADPSVRTGASDILQVPDAVSGSYVLKVTGEGAASYVLRALAAAGTGSSSHAIVLGQSQGQPQSYVMNYNPTTVTPPTPTDVPTKERSGFRGLDVGPNPAVGEVRINFSLEDAGAIDLAVYDVQGRRVASLLSGRVAKGPQAVSWDSRAEGTSRIRAGLYLVRLVVDGQSTVRRLVVMR